MERKKVIVGIGELLWDMLPSGKAIGGAPANFAYHAGRLGEEGWVVSAVGDDALGHEILDVLDEKRLHNLVAMVDKPTGTVQVSLDAAGVPTYTIVEDVAWDHIPFTPKMRDLASRADAVCFGSLVQRSGSRASVLKFLEAVPASALKIFDINLRQHFYTPEILRKSLEIADVLKINDEEIVTLSEMFGLGSDPREACLKLIRQYSLRFVLLTKGAQGSEVISPDEVIPQGVGKVDVVDTVGAGDAFTAAFTVAYLRGDSLADAQKLAGEVTAYVCSHKGAMPE